MNLYSVLDQGEAWWGLWSPDHVGWGEALGAFVIWLVGFYQTPQTSQTTIDCSNSRYTHTMGANAQDVEALVHSDDPNHPANHICTLCANFYTLGWVRCTLPAGVA
jgi:hypothetical protein